MERKENDPEAMRQLPLKAQLYILLIYLLGALTLVGASIVPAPSVDAQAWELVLFLVLGILAGSKKVRLMRHQGTADAGSMSLGFVLTFAAMLRFGPWAAVLVSTFSSLVGNLFPKRQPMHQLLFNLALSAAQS